MNRSARVALGSALFVAGACFPFVFTSQAPREAAVYFAYFLLLSASWNLLAGFTGQFSFAHMALATIGGYFSVLLNQYFGVPVAATFPLAGLLTAVVGCGLGAVTLRFRNIYLALGTFAFAGAFISWATGETDITGGDNGISANPLFPGDQTLAFLWLGLGLIAAYFLLQWAILSSRWGYFAMAVRDREEVAEGLGVRTVRVKIVAFAYTAFWAGLAGSFYAAYVGIVTPSIGALSNMGLIFAMAVVGGIGRAFGPIAGTLVFRVIDYEVRGIGGEYTVLIFSTILLAVMLFAREGVIGLIETAFRRVVPRRARWVAT